MQKINWPWDLKKWSETRRNITGKINSIVDMDTKISSMHGLSVLKPRLITQLFTAYYQDDPEVPQNHFVDNIIPMMQKLLEDAPKLFRGFDSRVLVPGHADNIVLTRPQVATIIAGMWFGLFNYAYITKGPVEMTAFPDPTFANIFVNQNIFALKCLLNYFNRVHQHMNGDDNTKNLFMNSNIILKRNVESDEVDWVDSEVSLCDIQIGEGPYVDDTPAKMQIVSAHELIGGNNLFGGSLSPEEVVLLIRPECLVATLFCSSLYDDTLTILGAEKMSSYSGHGSSVKYGGACIDSARRGYSNDDTESIVQCALIFMDASPKSSGKAQFIDDFLRDLNKAYCGFNSLPFVADESPVATGTWSYGFNGNHMQLKFIQQLMAVSQAGKSMIYHSFSHEFEDELISFITWIRRNSMTVGDLCRAYLQLINQCGSGTRLTELDLFECLTEY